MPILRSLALLLCILATGGVARAETLPGALPDGRVATGHRNISQAYLADPTGRYQHFVLGSDHEAGSLVVRLADGRVLKLVLPEDEVFEDRVPRLADLDGDGTDDIILVRSSRTHGSAVVVIAERTGRLAIIAETPSTGAPRRWLNPAGIADFNGDGRLDLAYVQQPHALGQLRVFTFANGGLREIATLPGVSNHAAGSNQQGLSAVADFNGDGIADLAVPSFDRRSLLFISLRPDARVIATAPLPAAATSDFKLEKEKGKSVVLVGLAGGRRVAIPVP